MNISRRGCCGCPSQSCAAAGCCVFQAVTHEAMELLTNPVDVAIWSPRPVRTGLDVLRTGRMSANWRYHCDDFEREAYDVDAYTQGT